MTKRLSTGIPGLDEYLGGGLLPGTTTAIVAGTGLGKTQFSLQFLNAGCAAGEETQRGVILDLTARGDSQNHHNYAKALFDWTITTQSPSQTFDPDDFFAKVASGERYSADYFQAFPYAGRRVTKRDLDDDEWREWKYDLTRRLDATIAFLYTNFSQGARRLLVDGIEPVDRQGDSIQFEMLEYVVHQIVKKEAPWVARDLFRQNFRKYQEQIEANAYPPTKSARSFRTRRLKRSSKRSSTSRLKRGLFCAGEYRDLPRQNSRRHEIPPRALHFKHRGSVCSDEIIRTKLTAPGCASFNKQHR